MKTKIIIALAMLTLIMLTGCNSQIQSTIESENTPTNEIYLLFANKDSRNVDIVAYLDGVKIYDGKIHRYIEDNYDVGPQQEGIYVNVTEETQILKVIETKSNHFIEISINAGDINGIDFFYKNSGFETQNWSEDDVKCGNE